MRGRPDHCLVYRELLYCYGRRIGTKGVAVWSYIRLHQHGGGIWKELTGYAWASRATMGQDLGIADTRTLRDAIQALKASGLLIELRAGDLFGPEELRALHATGIAAGVPLHLQPNSLLLMVHNPLTREEFVRWDQGRECQGCAHQRSCQAHRDWQQERQGTTDGGEIPPPPAQEAENARGTVSAGPGGGEIPPKPDRPEPERDTLSLFESQRGPQRGPAPRNHPSAGVLGDQAQEHTPSPGRPAAPGASNPPEALNQRYERVLADLRRFADRRRTQVAILAQNLAAILGLADGRTVPQKSDYGRVGALAKRFGPEEVWTTACRLAGRELAGDPLAYLQRCLEGPAAEHAADPHRSAQKPGHEGASPRRPRPFVAGGRPGLGHLVLGAGRFGAHHTPERSVYIANLVMDIGRQFGDIEHFRENDAQAHNLWRASGMEEEAFVQLVYRARQTALRLAGARNRMAYFFIVLRSLLPPQAAASGPADERRGP